MTRADPFMFPDKSPEALTPAERLIVALDVNTSEEAQAIVDELGDLVNFYKVGWQLFLGTHFEFVKKLREQDKHVFLDLKMEDIPETIQLALNNAPDVEFIELMTLKGTSQLIQAAKAIKGGTRKTKFLMLTVLSSQDDEDMQEVLGEQASVDSIVKHRTHKALAAHCDGLIASGDSVKKIRGWFPEEEYGHYLIVAPGIRPEGNAKNDHKRTLTPYQAIMDGADYLVVGRPIAKVKNKKEVAESIIAEIKAADDYRKPQDDSTKAMLKTAVG